MHIRYMATTVTQNPLNEFNSFSYHHFLILVSSTAVADTLTDSETLFRFISGDAPEVQGAQVIVNPLISNRYVIQEIEWTSMLAANYVDFGSAVWSGGTMKIIEPRGMSFMNDLYDSVGALGTQIENCLWVLKTVFVGDTGVGSGPQRYQYINYVQPTVVLMTDLAISFDESGGQYDFTFAMADSGAGSYKHMDGAAFNTNTTVNLAGQDVTGAVPLEQALKRLEKHINDSYDVNFAKNKKTAESQGNVPPFERMQYEIVLPDDSPLRKPEYIVTSSKGQGMGADGSSANITVAVGTSATDAIMEVIKSCPKAVTDFVKDQTKTTCHVISSVIMNPVGSDPRKICRLTVIARQSPTIKTEEDETSVHEQALANGNYIEYDYMYTGQNIDVLDFEMKMNTGIAFFNTVLSRSTMKDDRSSQVAAEYTTSASSTSKFSSNKSQIYHNGQIGDPANSDKDQPTSVALFDQIMRQYTVLDNIMVNLRIRGNPRMLNGITPTQASILAGNTAVSNATGDTDTKLMEKWATVPVYCKVNVRMPKDGDLNTIENFWYDGLYRVMTVKNVFSGGDFSQELEMITEMDPMMRQVSEAPATIPSTQNFTISGESAEVELRIRAFMRMIRQCEGTAGSNGYKTLFGGGTFDSFATHPNRVVKTTNYQSTAAGAYQILYKTWNGLRDAHGDLTDFTPEKQDMACYYLLQGRKALPLIRANNITGAIKACNKEWASLPESPYGQPVKSMEQAIAMYNTYIEQEIAKNTTLEVQLGVLS